MSNNSIRSQPKLTPADKSADQAIDRVYQMFGPNLSLFFNAVYPQSKPEVDDSRTHVEWRQLKTR